MPTLAVIFDFGGVLYRVSAEWRRRLEAEYGLTQRDVRQIFGGPDAVEAQLGGARFTTTEMSVVMTEQLSDRLGDRASEAAHALCAIYLDPNEGEYDEPMIRLAEDLHRAGIGVGILSNGPADSEFGIMAPILARGCVDATVISGRDSVGKPSPEAFALILDRMHVTPGEACFMDDQDFPVEAARAVGISSIVYDGDASRVRSWLIAEGFPLRPHAKPR